MSRKFHWISIEFSYNPFVSSIKILRWFLPPLASLPFQCHPPSTLCGGWNTRRRQGTELCMKERNQQDWELHDVYLIPALPISFLSFRISFTCCHSNQDSCQSFCFPSSFIHLEVHLEGGWEDRNGNFPVKGLCILECPQNSKHGYCNFGIVSSCWSNINHK